MINYSRTKDYQVLKYNFAFIAIILILILSLNILVKKSNES